MRGARCSGGGCLRWYLTKILREMVPRETGDHRLPVSCEERAVGWEGAGGEEEELEMRNGTVDGLRGWKRTEKD